MKVVLFLSALAGVSAFAPAAQPRVSSPLTATAELTGLRGPGPETGGKIVSSLWVWEVLA
jgi:hypothetical protein